MQFDIQCPDDDAAGGALAVYVRRRLLLGLARHGDFVRQVHLRLARDAGGEAVCRIRVQLRDAAPAEVETHGPDSHAVADLAADRIARLVGHRFAHPRAMQVQPPAAPVRPQVLRRARRKTAAPAATPTHVAEA